MSDTVQTNPSSCCGPSTPKSDGPFAKFAEVKNLFSTPVWLILATLLAIVIFVPENLVSHIGFAGESLLSIAPFILLSVATAAYLKATGADQTVANALDGNPMTAIVIASAFGALSPFCSCGVIPLVAALLASGVPFAPVLAFCIASPIMDPEMFILTAAELGMEFTLVKTLAAIMMGMFAGYTTHMISKTGFVADGLKDIAKPTGCGALPEKVVVTWKFWEHAEKRQQFYKEGKNTSWFLARWLAFAFLLEGMMIAYIPADNIATILGDGNAFAIPLAALVGVPAYLNGYAAIPLVDGLMNLGMAPSTALTFMLAGSVTSIPAAIGIWSLVKPRLFALYLGFALVGSLLGGYAYLIIRSQIIG